MQLLIKQRVLSWTDTYDIYDETGTARYFVKASFLALGHRLHVYDRNGNELGVVKERLMTLLPMFAVEIGGRDVGTVEKRFTLFRPKYDVNYMNWRAEGDFLGWEYSVYEACCEVVHVTKRLLSWGDTYVIDIARPEDELPALMLVLAIDAANCTKGK